MQLKEKLRILEENAKQESQKIKAEEQVLTVKAAEVANRDKQIEVTKAEKNAQVELLVAKSFCSTLKQMMNKGNKS